MNILPLRERIQSYLRQDGRRVYPVRTLDFRPERDVFATSGAGYHRLLPGTLIGCIARYYWPGPHSWIVPPTPVDRSRRIHLLGEYTGQDTTLEVPIDKWHPGRKHESRVPVVDLMLWRDAYTKVSLGEVAVAYLNSGEKAVMGPLDHDTIHDSLDLPHMIDYQRAEGRIGAVQVGGLYYAVKPEQPSATIV